MNIVNCDWSGNIEDPENIDTMHGTMGCVHGDTIIRILFPEENDFMSRTVTTIADLWNALTAKGIKYNKVKTVGDSEYIDLAAICDENREVNFAAQDSLSLNNLTGIKKIIRNKSNGQWIKLYFNNDDNNYLICTEDHPLPIFSKGRVEARDIEVNDKIIASGDYMTDLTNVDANEVIEQLSPELDPYTYNMIFNKYTIHKIEYFDLEDKYSYDLETYSDRFDANNIVSHNCRTMIGFDRHGLGYSKVGRGNVCPVTLNLAKLGIKNGIALGERAVADEEKFWNDLQEMLHLQETALLDRFAYICSQSTKSAPFMYDNGTIKDADKSKASTVYESMKHGTLAVGFIGVAECCHAMFGKDHADGDEKVLEFAKKIVKTIYDFCKEASERNNLNFSCYATPEI